MGSSDPPTDGKVPCVYLDCSNTYQSGARNGIQRVVRNIARESRAVAAEQAIHCQPVVRNGNSYYRVPYALQTPADWVNFWAKLKRPYFAVMSILLLPLPIPILHKWLLPKPGHRGIFNIPLRLWRKVQGWKQAILRLLGIASDPLVNFAAGDTLVVMEPCSYSKSWESIDLLRQQGVHIGLLVYDLIPLTHTQFCDHAYARCFENWLQETSQRADYFLSISDTVSQDVEGYLRDSQLPRQWDSAQFDSFRLGADLDAVTFCGKVRNQVKEAFKSTSGVPNYLLVAMLEPRKNHKFLLDAFELAWQQGSPARLVLVGRIGWMCDDIIARIQNHPELGQRLTWFNDLSDTELQYCYKHASGLVYPSIIEGFGLPLVEALSHRLPVLASDIPVHREVGQDYCAYFDLQRPDQLADMICELDRDPNAFQLRDPAEYDIADWRQSCREFLTGVVKQTRRLNQKAVRGEQSRGTASTHLTRQVA